MVPVPGQAHATAVVEDHHGKGEDFQALLSALKRCRAPWHCAGYQSGRQARCQLPGKLKLKLQQLNRIPCTTIDGLALQIDLHTLLR